MATYPVGLRLALEIAALTATLAIEPHSRRWPQCTFGFFPFLEKIAVGRVWIATPGPDSRWSMVPGRAPADNRRGHFAEHGDLARPGHGILAHVLRVSARCFVVAKGLGRVSLC